MSHVLNPPYDALQCCYWEIFYWDLVGLVVSFIGILTVLALIVNSGMVGLAGSVIAIETGDP